MASHRYWRIQSKLTQSGTNFALGEVQFRGTPGGADLATGGVPMASSTFAGSAAANAFDDNPATWWATLTNQHIDGWIGYDFGSAVTIQEVVLSARADTSFGQAPSRFYVAGSDDGVTWTDYKMHVPATWTNGASQTFAVPAAVEMGALRVGAAAAEVLHSSKGALRVGTVALVVLRSVSTPPFSGRRRQQQVT